MRRLLAVCAVVSLIGMIAPSCRTPTEIVVDVSLDFSCGDLKNTTVTVGAPSDVETAPPVVVTAECKGGRVGSVVLVPSGTKNDNVAIKVVGGFVTKTAEQCTPPYGAGCIVARRVLRYIPHTALSVPIVLQKKCDGIPCDATTTCLDGVCVPAICDDRGRCPSPSGDAGDAASDGNADSITPTTYNDFTNVALWSTFVTTTANPSAKGFRGGTFDGRYVYLAPFDNGTYDGVAARYDTQKSFAAAASWEVFDVTTIAAAATGFTGAGFDGRYVYLLPFNYHVARYDTLGSFTAAGSWSVFRTDVLDTNAWGFMGAAFDGRNFYFTPFLNGQPSARYDTQGPLTQTASWSTFDMTTVSPNAKNLAGNVFDGRYVYYAPYNNGAPDGVVARYDTQGSYTAAASWSTFDATTVNANAVGFLTAAFDGRYVYLAPTMGAPRSVVARYDTQASFTAPASWSTFEVTTLNADAWGFNGSAFDGRYLYLVPHGNAGGLSLLVRYDTQASFTAPTSWSTFDTNKVDADTGGFCGAVFDGRYLYLVPWVGVTVARFDAKSPPSMPSLPGFHGSFL